ncbi:Charged multivesicular body protein 7 [Orchesella cincta]|uniref:Charged multivesicular body protein 7 n=1 Tax=Orchesella cincta TaxID=48709 RepID=A0A1D2N595_ORCCI|nr:Charged multivesicular body protein 7 [Orchesella cincta]
MTISTVRVPSIEGISADKDRVSALYAPFRSRESNPEHYDRKLKFWTKAIQEYGSTCKRISFTVKELQKEFRIDGKSPACLKEVIDQFCKDGIVLTEKDFLENLRAAESWKAWSTTSAWRVVRKVGSFVPSPISYFYRASEEEIRFVNVELLKELSESVVSNVSLQNKLMNVSLWNSKVREVTSLADATDLEFFLGYMKARKLIVIDKVGSEEVVFMSSTGSQPKITDVEKGKYDITRTKEILETQLNDITEKAQQAEERARAALKQGRRNTAKHELRRKKLLEQRMDKLLSMVDNLTVLGMQIEDAESDAVIVSAYEAGKKALAGVLEDKRMNADRVTEAMLDIQELLDQHSDVSAALSQPMDGQDSDILSLEEELDSILREDEEKSKLPPPVSDPKPAKSQKNTDEEEALKMLEDLGMNDLEDFSQAMSSPKEGRLDKSGDV